MPNANPTVRLFHNPLGGSAVFVSTIENGRTVVRHVPTTKDETDLLLAGAIAAEWDAAELAFIGTVPVTPWGQPAV